ncbi:2-amino-4-hydroxy-6-hydroxymethyldihydropteridine diphosphokinase [Mucilaginibacter sp. PPCGB 2223]|uniref:2-amino-4-hydroxy-6- hydroxymethyldihydropteridine diphosphokinase n=1 Tax=Mucilaginibacter sp. PPCGB 2223 TaxID=1886027 RepID=UPI000824C3D1|nr:2-amino-4-hydroxy-6-hydroxymethyldihydropteridine diphosphokinase [Mucilaginibacter sp. PPCGB 2223]OCX54490.1 2-amino-4-hydroxy-6-hydroxymethyldihydropteridine diphosphokinase [Mucilaginibacter sp. PPCGB 2223]
MVDVFLLLGSNLGNRQLFLNEACTGIVLQVGRIVKRSSVYETQSWGKTDEPDYLNQVLQVSTALKPREVLERILAIEKSLGRERLEKWGSRTIDIDILFYDNEVINQPDLVIPHPHLHQRKFVLEPLAEIAPQYIHPVLNKNILQLNNFKDSLIVKKL